MIWSTASVLSALRITKLKVDKKGNQHRRSTERNEERNGKPNGKRNGDSCSASWCTIAMGAHRGNCFSRAQGQVLRSYWDLELRVSYQTKNSPFAVLIAVLFPVLFAVPPARLAVSDIIKLPSHFKDVNTLQSYRNHIKKSNSWQCFKLDMCDWKWMEIASPALPYHQKLLNSNGLETSRLSFW